MCCGKLAQTGAAWKYEVMAETLEGPETGPYVAYGLQVVGRPGCKAAGRVPDVCTDRETAEKMAELFNTFQLDPVQLEEAVLDFISCPEALERAYCSLKR